VYLLFIFLVLDPRIKLTYYESQEWEKEYIDISTKILKDTYNDYYCNNITTSSSSTITNDIDNIGIDFFSFGLKNNPPNEDELAEYLSKPTVNYKTDPLEWWKVTN